MTLDGIEFINAKPAVVINHLSGLNRRRIKVRPSGLHIIPEGKHLVLRILKEGKKYPLRKSFLYKLLKWYSFPLYQLGRLSLETTASVCNDFLLNIDREYVTVKLEGDEALTITSPDYDEITDLEIIRRASSMGLGSISRNDFMMRLTTEQKLKFEVVKGDDCGIGLSIMNSETGFHSLRVCFFLLRYICTNGAVIRIDQEKKSKIHYGCKPGELAEFLEEQNKIALEKRAVIIESIRRLPDKKVSDNPEIIDKVRRILKREELKSVPGMTQYELFNLITERAKKYDLSTRIYLESAAGEMILN